MATAIQNNVSHVCSRGLAGRIADLVQTAILAIEVSRIVDDQAEADELLETARTTLMELGQEVKAADRPAPTLGVAINAELQRASC